MSRFNKQKDPRGELKRWYEVRPSGFESELGITFFSSLQRAVMEMTLQEESGLNPIIIEARWNVAPTIGWAGAISYNVVEDRVINGVKWGFADE